MNARGIAVRGYDEDPHTRSRIIETAERLLRFDNQSMHHNRLVPRLMYECCAAFAPEVAVERVVLALEHAVSHRSLFKTSDGHYSPTPRRPPPVSMPSRSMQPTPAKRPTVQPPAPVRRSETSSVAAAVPRPPAGASGHHARTTATSVNVTRGQQPALPSTELRAKPGSAPLSPARDRNTPQPPATAAFQKQRNATMKPGKKTRKPPPTPREEAPRYPKPQPTMIAEVVSIIESHLRGWAEDIVIAERLRRAYLGTLRKEDAYAIVVRLLQDAARSSVIVAHDSGFTLHPTYVATRVIPAHLVALSLELARVLPSPLEVTPLPAPTLMPETTLRLDGNAPHQPPQQRRERSFHVTLADHDRAGDALMIVFEEGNHVEQVS